MSKLKEVNLSAICMAFNEFILLTNMKVLVIFNALDYI